MKRQPKPNRNGGRAHGGGGGGKHHGGQNQSQLGGTRNYWINLFFLSVKFVVIKSLNFDLKKGRKGGNSAFGHEDLEILEDEPIESEDDSDDEWDMEDEEEEQSTVSKMRQGIFFALRHSLRQKRTPLSPFRIKK